jgi:two-component system response regulator YesN
MQNEGLRLNQQSILKLLRDRVLMDMVANQGDQKYCVQDKLSELQLNPYFNYPTIALLEPTSSYMEKSAKRRDIERMRDYLQQFIPDGSVVFMCEDDRIGLLFSWAFKDVIESIPTLLNNQFSYLVNIGFGKPYSHLSDIYISYEQALHALKNKFYQGTGQSIYFSELEVYEQLYDYPLAEEKVLFNCIKTAVNYSDIVQGVDEFYEHLLQKGPIDIKNCYELTIRLLVGMEKRVLKDVEQVSVFMRFEIMSIIGLETLEEIKHYVSKYFMDIRDIISRNASGTQRTTIKKMIHYMELECQNVTLASIAEKLYMAPTYLSLLFKTNTGKTFIEQLTDIRLEKARDMLLDTSMRNYEVAEKVGYHDSRYFSQIFRRKFGVSPTEYRESTVAPR